ncbi:MAG: cobalamin B12-binding domain-containing protein [bacterium]|nr:cobalamin B12-binding domain-containing protein [bacterium]
MVSTQSSSYRIVVAKPGLDGHDRGAKVVARALRDAGMEVIYTGLHQLPEQIVETALQEDADVIGVSILSGAHLTVLPKIFDLLREREAEDVVVIVGGVIQPQDVPKLHAMGVAAVYDAEQPLQALVDAVRRHAAERRARIGLP